MLFLIWADEKYNTQKNPSVVFATQKNPGIFHRPQKIPFGQNVRPQKILWTPPSLKYVSGAPGSHTKTPAYVVLNDLRLIRDMTFQKMLTSRLKMQKVPFRPVRDARFNLFSLSWFFLISEKEKCICGDLIQNTELCASDIVLPEMIASEPQRKYLENHYCHWISW